MTPKNEAPTLLVLLLMTMTLLTGGVWWSAGRMNLDHLLSLNPQILTGRSPTRLSPVLAERFSQGERLLIEMGALPEKQLGVTAMASSLYPEAAQYFEASLAVNPNDPEALIYLNNARIGQGLAYTLAVVVPSGRDLSSTLEILRGAAQTQNEVNQTGGIQGVPLRLVLVNDDGDVAIAPQIADLLIQNGQILGVVGHSTTEATQAAASRYEDGELVAISPLSTATPPPREKRFTFRTLPGDFMMARALAHQMLNRLQQQKVALFYSSTSASSRSLRLELGSALTVEGGQLLREYDLAGPGFSPVDSFNQAALQGATALILLPDAAQVDRALQVVRVNRGRLSLLGGSELYSAKTLEIVGPESVGMVTAVPWHVLTDPNSLFVQRSRQLWQGDVNWRTAMTYDAMQALVAAMRQNPTRKGIAEALLQPNFFAAGATGVVQFLPGGDRSHASIQFVQVQPGFRSGYGYDFVPAEFAPVFEEPTSLGFLPLGQKTLF
ncbi:MULTISPECIES: ABC transporter substrate-binding protein [unclassified Leptolyngbya]|uniref:ABC transporter substrate-binding protein n=1 Tax=unclassified Leptolyngbya TaxID=2650499 RepID=UPI001685F84B|nr:MULTISPECIES: ABC transporter substrate-binding protein [unclassified Leptolyngbya]MBD1912006.1 amino acid ABC transporter substrate-binding protein [Leptolyngbya sp. FACHB-8]MBD2155376.1 amino acid ABC transporter substrate-binding protein [Leptolyngbya sp. FACHB-16]